MTIPVTVLTGFLGSGKTTVLNYLVRQPALAGTVVIVNELGEIALDHLLIEHTAENIKLLRSGCVCCAVRGDLVETLHDLAARRESGALELRRVIIETTGLADPAPILHTLMVEPDVGHSYRLEGVVTTVDAVNGAATLETHREAVKQAATADLLLLTKTDLALPQAAEMLKHRLARLNRGAAILAVTGGRVDAAQIAILNPFQAECKGDDVRRWLNEAAPPSHAADTDLAQHPGHSHRHAEAVRTHSIVIEAPVRRQDFSSWLELMAAMRGERLLRLKGIVAVAEHPDRPLVVHGVQHIIHPIATLESWPSADRRTRLVLITHEVPRELIERTLERFANVRREDIEHR